MKAIVISIVFYVAVFVQCAEAQRLIERGWILNPMESVAYQPEDYERRWFTQVGGWGSFGSYALGGDRDHHWHQQLAAFAEIYRHGNKWSVAITSQIEFIANDDNDVNFSPRAIFWEEGVMVTRRQNGLYLQFGYYHRCKHDIDNLRIGEERTSVFGSAMAAIILPVKIRERSRATFALRYDHYTITWEKRTPAQFWDAGPNWEDLTGSLMLNADWSANRRTVNMHLNGYAMGTMLRNETLFNGMLRAEIGRTTAAGDLRFGIHAERLGDSGIPVRPAPATLIGIGVRIMAPGSII
ncbi:MAG: hypothetical protein EA391_14190 [Balneolaceae bacterium]|nr:MAG: hypothetical protein EA391_14190 [Balneolaceae bacterium]